VKFNSHPKSLETSKTSKKGFNLGSVLLFEEGEKSKHKEYFFGQCKIFVEGRFIENE